MIAAILNQIPVPKNIPLPLPLPEWVLVFILIFSFLLHILFINLMIGGSLLTFWYQLRGRKNKDYDVLAHEIANTITVNKSMAVVLGVAPLLSINVLYTIYFYSANALTGDIWISVIPWVTVSFLLLYLHKYSWTRLENNKALHISILGTAVVGLLFIPFIFLTNINLMLFPEKWVEVKGFTDAITLPNVIPRYFHFIVASIAVTGLFLTFWFGRKNFEAKVPFRKLSKPEIKKQMLNLTIAATGMQFIFGPLLFLTLPSKGVTWGLFWVILAGVFIASIILYQIWKLLNDLKQNLNKRFWGVVGLFLLLVTFMGTGRHIYRDNALKTHQMLMENRTTAHWEAVKQAHINMTLPESESIKEASLPGEELYQINCAVCHASTTRLIGPPMMEAVLIYKDNPEKLKQWIKNPGRKRMDFPPMAGFPHFTDQQLSAVSNYVLTRTWN